MQGRSRRSRADSFVGKQLLWQLTALPPRSGLCCSESFRAPRARHLPKRDMRSCPAGTCHSHAAELPWGHHQNSCHCGSRDMPPGLCIRPETLLEVLTTNSLVLTTKTDYWLLTTNSSRLMPSWGLPSSGKSCLGLPWWPSGAKNLPARM